ncbi:hypothetical protein EDD86DRAFT_215229 [Gorgonomyces haynaldii]|nr:hypothetical protein EDD86DRAFT_215229 [Gorgonomyces haynaldii]
MFEYPSAVAHGLAVTQAVGALTPLTKEALKGKLSAGALVSLLAVCANIMVLCTEGISLSQYILLDTPGYAMRLAVSILLLPQIVGHCAVLLLLKSHTTVWFLVTGIVVSVLHVMAFISGLAFSSSNPSLYIPSLGLAESLAVGILLDGILNLYFLVIVHRTLLAKKAIRQFFQFEFLNWPAIIITNVFLVITAIYTFPLQASSESLTFACNTIHSSQPATIL